MMRSTNSRPGRGVVHLEHRIIEFDCTTLGPRWKLLLVQEWTQPTVTAELVVSLKTTTLITVLLAAFAATAVSSARKSEAIVHRVADGKVSKTECAIILCTHSLEIEACERNVLSGSSALCTQASLILRRQFCLI